METWFRALWVSPDEHKTIPTKVNLVVLLGDDIFAENAMKVYQNEGMETEHIYREQGINTGVGLVTLLDAVARAMELGRKHGATTIWNPAPAKNVPMNFLANTLDPTGAGDSFNAALAVGLGGGLPLLQAVEKANHAGAYCVEHLGVIDGLPSKKQLEEFRKKKNRVGSIT